MKKNGNKRLTFKNFLPLLFFLTKRFSTFAENIEKIIIKHLILNRFRSKELWITILRWR